MQAVFGRDLNIPFELEVETSLNGLGAIGAAELAVSERAIEQYRVAGEAVAAAAFADAGVAASWVGCDAEQEFCALSFLEAFGQRAFRRRLSESELSRYLTVYLTSKTALGTGLAGLEFAVAGILQSPNFLYRVELGQPSTADPNVYALSEHELASKLAYFLWDGPPDVDLLAAADAGALSTAQTLSSQVQRLLASPQHRVALESFFDDALGLRRLEEVDKLSSVYPEFDQSLAADFRTQTRLTLADAVVRGLDFRAVLADNTTFVNSRLAEFYGIPGTFGTDFVAATFPVESLRPGVFGHGSLLSIHAHASATSPTLRGKFVRETLLCQGIPAPPPGVDTTLPDASMASTTRDRFSIHASTAACQGCHSLMDPIGLGLENFDGIGRFRDTENGFAIDASGELDGVPFAKPAELAAAIANHPNLPECVTRTVFRYGWGRLEQPGEVDAVRRLALQFSVSNYSFSELLAAAALSVEFRTTGALD
jgi:hypothetical protein